MTMKKIYVASSWRNEFYPKLVDLLRKEGHEVHDWRSTPNAFSWTKIEPEYQHGDTVATAEYRNWLLHPASEAGFKDDCNGMEWADIGILLLPAGASAHTEAAYMRGRGKHVFILRPDNSQPELMYKLFTAVFGELAELFAAIKAL